MLKLLVGCGGGDEETLLVTGSQTADDTGSGDCGVADRNDILEFSFEDTARSMLAHTLRCRHTLLGARVRGTAHTCRSFQKRLLRQSHRHW